MLKKVQQGFTLIELMIVVAIIGILAAIAIPAYQNYTIRSQVTEGLSLADGWKTAISEYFAQNGTFPTGVSTAGGVGKIAAAALSSTGKYVAAVTVTAAAPGAIQITYGLAANAAITGANNMLALTPYTNTNNDIVWVCGTSPVPAGAVLTGGAVAGTSNVKPQYLPSSCHT
jgi:type IV pilus assembly protein PilA